MRKWVWLLIVALGAALLTGCAASPNGRLKVGEAAPDFVLQDLEGNEVRLSDFAGRPVLLNFWNTWCPPCRTEMPALQEVYTAQGADGLQILAVNLLYQENDLRDVTQFVQEKGLTFPILLDETGEVAVRYRVGSLPTSVFVDREGKVHLIQVGPMSRAFVQSVLQEIR